MSEVIEVDFSVQWSTPVYVRTTEGFRETISGPEDALDCMTKRWPAITKGPCYYAAKRECMAAIRKRASVSAARESFVSAGIEAGLLR
ncbi:MULTISPECIES: DUF982 domain-containing protein [unclassified Sinorhizobium]|uniref:DUF982 domain-containing protein n=1 Tax=unclassified Sinorhizobium TaxID=2613772 RepID=UPI0035258549